MAIVLEYNPAGEITSPKNVSVTVSYTNQAIGDVVSVHWGTFEPVHSKPATSTAPVTIAIPESYILDGEMSAWCSITDKNLQIGYSGSTRRLMDTHGASSIAAPTISAATNGSKSGFTAKIPGNPATDIFLKQGDIIEVIWDIFDNGAGIPNLNKRTFSPAVTLDANYLDGYLCDLHPLGLAPGERIRATYTIQRTLPKTQDVLTGDTIPASIMLLKSTYGDIVASRLPPPIFTQANNGILNLAYVIGNIAIEIPAPADSASTLPLTVYGIGLDAQGQPIEGTAFQEGPQIIKINPHRTSIPRALFLPVPEDGAYSLYYRYGNDISPATSVSIITNTAAQTGRIWGWGQNCYGQIGTDVSGTSGKVPLQEVNERRWLMASAGYYHVMAIAENGALYGWGQNSYGQIGTGDTNGANILGPHRIGEKRGWKHVSGGLYHTLAIDNNGDLWAAGYNAYGALANGNISTNNTFTLTHIDNADIDGKWSSVNAGYYNGIGIKADSSLWAWGYNAYGQLGLGDTTHRATPQQLGSALKWKKAAISLYATIALTEDGEIYIWGSNKDGLLTPTGLPPTSVLSYVPRKVNFLNKKWSDITLGDTHAMAIEAESGALYVWGSGSNGQLGLGSTVTTKLPQPRIVEFPVIGKIIQINTLTNSSTAILLDPNGERIAFGWGSDNYGQVIGDGLARGVVWVPAPVHSSSRDWISLHSGAYSTIGLRTDN